MRVVLFGHAGVGVTELLGDDGNRNATHGKLRGVGMPQHVKRDRRCNARLCLATLRRGGTGGFGRDLERLRAEGFDAASRAEPASLRQSESHQRAGEQPPDSNRRRLPEFCEERHSSCEPTS